MSWIPSYKKPGSGGGMPEIVTWSEGTDEQIVAMVEAHYNGIINLHDYWTVGDYRTVSLSAMSAYSPLTDTYNAQDITLVLTNAGGKYLSDGTTECAFQVDLLYYLKNGGAAKMTTTQSNSGGWKECPRRGWCNDTYYNAFPSSIKSIFKEFINQSGAANGTTSWSGVDNTTDYFALRAEIEISGTTLGSVSGEGSQVTWYETSANRIKRDSSGGTAYSWWTRSAKTSDKYRFLRVKDDGSLNGWVANNGSCVLPFGVI